jgi:hypothetical protein
MDLDLWIIEPCLCLGSGLWQLIASWLSWPVAGTHCIIFGLLGFTVAAEGRKLGREMRPESIREKYCLSRHFKGLADLCRDASRLVHVHLQSTVNRQRLN